MTIVGPIIEGICGLGIIVLVISDIFQAILTPRATGSRLRLSAQVAINSWQLWLRISWRLQDADKREALLALYAPLLLATFLVLWMISLMAGFGLCFHALAAQVRPHPSLFESWYLAGTTFLTLGFGDFVGTQAAARILSLFAAGTGVATVAVVTAFLFAIFGSFQRRETFVVALGHAAGAPASGVNFLATYAKLDLRADLSLVFRDAQMWAAEVMESHLAYPILLYFRSSHDDESWLATLGALLDAATLASTTIATPNLGQAQLFLELGIHVMRDFSAYFRFSEPNYVGVEHGEFMEAYNQLAEFGFELVEPEAAWDAFAKQRRRYANYLNAIARYFSITPSLWIGDRSPLIKDEGVSENRHR